MQEEVILRNTQVAEYLKPNSGIKNPKEKEKTQEYGQCESGIHQAYEKLEEGRRELLRRNTR